MLPFCRSPWTNQYAPLFSHTHYLLYTIIGMKWACRYSTVNHPGKVANPDRGVQLNTGNNFFTVCYPCSRLRILGFARRVRPSRPASACSFSILYSSTQSHTTAVQGHTYSSSSSSICSSELVSSLSLPASACFSILYSTQSYYGSPRTHTIQQ